MNDRRRINGPSGGTSAPIYSKCISKHPQGASDNPMRMRNSNGARKIFLKTGVTPSASGSAYFELESHLIQPNLAKSSLTTQSASSLKLTCTVHGPRPLPRSAPFSPIITLTTHVKYAPFASRIRRSHIRDSTERDLAVHLETALRGVIIGDRWPKSGVEVIVTVLEGEEDSWFSDMQMGMRNINSNSAGPWSMMSVLSGCITVASAAIADAGIDCVDMVSGGIAAFVRVREDATEESKDPGLSPIVVVLDPLPSEHHEILAACVVGYLPSSDEITDLWLRGDVEVTMSNGELNEISAYEYLANSAVQAALGAYSVLIAATEESAKIRLRKFDSA